MGETSTWYTKNIAENFNQISVNSTRPDFIIPYVLIKQTFMHTVLPEILAEIKFGSMAQNEALKILMGFDLALKHN